MPTLPHCRLPAMRTLLLSAVSLLVLAACSGNETPTPNGPADSGGGKASSAAPPPAAAADQASESAKRQPASAPASATDRPRRPHR